MRQTHDRTGTATAIGAFTFVSLLVLFCGTAVAKEATWYKYENSHFMAFSDESERATRKLLNELENFRAAVLQVANIAVPADAPKTKVVLFASQKRFHKLVGSRLVGGFATYILDVPVIVLPAGTYSSTTETTIRHEYTHILLKHKGIQYPTWFNEGFAELMSATTFRAKGTRFSVGEPTGRRRSGRKFMRWSKLISADFNPHSRNSGALVSDAYLQCWLLTHYFMLGNNFDNTILLSRYISRLRQGQESVAAFESVVGMSADKFGDNVVRDYSLTYMIYDFHKSAMDHDFERSEVADAARLPVFQLLRDLFGKDQEPAR